LARPRALDFAGTFIAETLLDAVLVRLNCSYDGNRLRVRRNLMCSAMSRYSTSSGEAGVPGWIDVARPA